MAEVKREHRELALEYLWFRWTSETHPEDIVLDAWLDNGGTRLNYPPEYDMPSSSMIDEEQCAKAIADTYARGQAAGFAAGREAERRDVVRECNRVARLSEMVIDLAVTALRVTFERGEHVGAADKETP